MAQKSVASHVSGALADATGRTEDELRLALLVAVALAALFAALRLLKWLDDLGSNVLRR